jgi:hypothetical protein
MVMGNRDKRDDKAKKKSKKEVKVSTVHSQITEVPPPVEVVRRRRKEDTGDDAD